MAAIQMYVHFKDTPDVEGLCPKCLNPALKKYTLERITIDGITFMGTRIACTDCRTWLEPVQTIPETTQ